MRNLIFALACILIPAAAYGAGAPAKEEHPGEVALLQEAAGWSYKHFPTNLRLYVFDEDGPDKSNCYKECSAVWPPVDAHDNPKPMGDWSLVARADGRTQWAYKHRPVYVRYHDSVEAPIGNGVDGKWHFLEP